MIPRPAGRPPKLTAAPMEPFVQKLPLPHAPGDLVAPASLREKLDQVLARARRPSEEPPGEGLIALFAGPSGTGKTTAVQILARQLDLELYRIDLSRVVGKYIGETEKNLRRLLDEAQTSKGILFFDEADALFGKRTAVRDAHDRFADNGIGYLLERLETHRGIAVLATKSLPDEDEALMRRFEFVIEFPTPSGSERLTIWERIVRWWKARPG